MGQPNPYPIRVWSTKDVYNVGDTVTINWDRNGACVHVQGGAIAHLFFQGVANTHSYGPLIDPIVGSGSLQAWTTTQNDEGSWNVQVKIESATGSPWCVARGSTDFQVTASSATQPVTTSIVTQPVNGKIVFTSTRDDPSGEVYMMNSDGSDQTRLTYIHAYTLFSGWSPDGSKLAFVSNTTGHHSDIYVMNAEGSGQIALTDNSGDSFRPVWSSDGSKIAFTSNTDGNLEIYVMNADGSGQTRLTNNPAVDSDQAWSPDGRKIAFTSDRDAKGEDIYVMNADGSEVTRLTSNSDYDNQPTWSPDGKQILFYSNRGGTESLWLMNGDGSNQHRLTNNPWTDFWPAWSPDGRKIAFVAIEDPNCKIYVINPDGSGQMRLTDAPGRNNGATWSPDGSKIAFMSNRDGNWEIYVINADGSGQTRLTNNPANNYFPVWQPVATSSSTAVSFTFRVHDSDSGSSVSGASVSFDDSYVGMTDSSGWITITTTYPPADHSYRVSAAGYEDDSSTITIGSNSGGWFNINLMRSTPTQTVQQTVSASTSMGSPQTAVPSQLLLVTAIAVTVVVALIGGYFLGRRKLARPQRPADKKTVDEETREW